MQSSTAAMNMNKYGVKLNEEGALPGTMRWSYGKIVKVISGKELLDIDLDNGEQVRAAPTFDVDVVHAS